MELLKMLREAKHPSQDCQCPPCTAQVWLKKTLFPSITLWLRSPESSLSEQLPCDREAEPAHAQPGLEREESKGGMRSWVALRRRWGCPGSPPSPIPPVPLALADTRWQQPLAFGSAALSPCRGPAAVICFVKVFSTSFSGHFVKNQCSNKEERN